MNQIISLDQFRSAVETAEKEMQDEFKDLYFGHAGIMPVKPDEDFRYTVSPLNTTIFAHTGGDGIHYSLLRLTDSIQPVIMTDPTNFGSSTSDYNVIIAENLNEFLSLGYYNGWFFLYELFYKKEWAISFHQTENKDESYQLSDGQIHFVKKMRQRLGYGRSSLDHDKLQYLKDQYFHHLIFKQEFLDDIEKWNKIKADREA